MRDPYEVLGLAPGATEDEIKAAYKALAQKYSAENYAASPLEGEAAQRMQEINEAFDQLMGAIRTGNAGASASNEQNAPDEYVQIRRLINDGQADEALHRLQAIGAGETSGEWNFLCGSAYYYKGWLDQALPYFEAAVRLSPENREYSAAYYRLRNSASGNIAGNPYSSMPQGAMGCSCCDMCTALMCMDLCCGFGRGGCC